MIYISNNEFKIIIKILKKYASDCDVFVFGSRYKGNYKIYSDLDLAFDCGLVLSFKRLQEITEAFQESLLPYRVDIIDYFSASKEFKDIIDKAKKKIFSGKRYKN